MSSRISPSGSSASRERTARESDPSPTRAANRGWSPLVCSRPSGGFDSHWSLPHHRSLPLGDLRQRGRVGRRHIPGRPPPASVLFTVSSWLTARAPSARADAITPAIGMGGASRDESETAQGCSYGPSSGDRELAAGSETSVHVPRDVALETTDDLSLIRRRRPRLKGLTRRSGHEPPSEAGNS